MALVIRAKSKITPNQLGKDQFLLAWFIDSSALYSWLVQSQSLRKQTNRSDLICYL
jgi:hypothetical protein